LVCKVFRIRTQPRRVYDGVQRPAEQFEIPHHTGRPGHYKAGIDQFSALIVDAEDGGKKAISAKDKQRIG